MKNKFLISKSISSSELRLDFITFVINGPNTDYTATDALTQAGAAVGTGGTAASLASRCLTDVFSVSNPGGPSPPQICGTATDEHSKATSDQPLE